MILNAILTDIFLDIPWVEKDENQQSKIPNFPGTKEGNLDSIQGMLAP